MITDERITLFLTDDHQIIVEGIMALVAGDACIQVVGHCNDGMEMLDKVQDAQPDVLILDISLPGINGLDLCRMVKARLPQTSIMMLTMHSNEQCIIDAFQNGATGYLIKEAVSQEFCEAVHAVARGEIYLGESLPRSVLQKVNCGEPDPYDTLTDRERMVLQLFAEGKSNRQIGETLDISSGTVHSDRAQLMNKLDLHSQTELIKFAIRKRIIMLA